MEQILVLFGNFKIAFYVYKNFKISVFKITWHIKRQS